MSSDMTKAIVAVPESAVALVDSKTPESAVALVDSKTPFGTRKAANVATINAVLTETKRGTDLVKKHAPQFITATNGIVNGVTHLQLSKITTEREAKAARMRAIARAGTATVLMKGYIDVAQEVAIKRTNEAIDRQMARSAAQQIKQ